MFFLPSGIFFSRLLWTALLVLIASCEQTATGNLNITVTGLPSDANADITVSGPANYSKKITASAALSGLEPGNYTLTVAEVGPLTPYIGLANPQTVQVSANSTSNIGVEYFLKNLEESSNNNDKATAQLLRYGVTANATIELPGDQDWYRFVAQAGDFIRLDIDAHTLNGAWGSGDGANGVYLELYDGSSTPPNYLAFSDFSSTITTLSAQYDPPGDAMITYLINQPGNYYVRAYGRYSNVGTVGHQYRLKLSRTAVPWSSSNLRVIGGHLKDYERAPNGIPGYSILGNAVVDVFEAGGDFNPTGKFNYTVQGPPGWNGGNPYSGNVEFFGHQVAIVFAKDPDVTASLLGGLQAPSRSLSIARVEPLQVGNYTLSIDIHGKSLSKTFSINSADALGVPQNISVAPPVGSNNSLRVSWNAVAGAKKYVIFVHRPNGSTARNIEVPPTTSTVVQLFNTMQTGEKYRIEVFAHDFNYLADILSGKYNKSGNLLTEFTYVAP